MIGYLPINEASGKAGITIYMLNKLIEDGKVRVKETSDISRHSNSRLRYVCLQDIIDAQSDLELSYIDISRVGSVYGLTSNAVRHQIKKHRLRWRRNGVHLQPCSSDLDLFVQDSKTKPVGRPKGTLSASS
ncbi:MAG: hypothetical protein LBM00_05520 [Deltaproteobacteria bacterium]|jgi:hypothetical protein|nr:hypothetical protein [Deltaproteobacteria bacterium]